MSTGTAQQRARGRKVRKDVKDAKDAKDGKDLKRQPKPKEEPPKVRTLAQVHAILEAQTQARVQAQSQLRAQIQMQAQLQAQAQAQAQLVKQVQSQIQAQEQAQAKAQEQAQAQAQAQAKAEALAQAQAQEQVRAQAEAEAQAQALAQAQAQTQAQAQAQTEAQGQTQKLQEQSQETINLRLTLERLKLQHQELRRNHITSPQLQAQAQQIPKQSPNAPPIEEEAYYTPKETTRKQSEEEAVIRMRNASAAFICYKSRLNKLEEEMDKCKRQLCHYVQDNKELLNKQCLRHHIEQLLQPVTAVAAAEAATAMTASATLPNETLPAVDQSTILSQAQLEQERQRQLREFLARDEQNANAFELPNLCNVYKVSSCHAHAKSQATSQPVDRCESVPSTTHLNGTYATRSTSFHGFHSQPTEKHSPLTNPSIAWSELDPSQAEFFKKLQPKKHCPENLEIQENEFYKDYKLSNYKHMTGK